MSQLPRYESYKDSGVQWLGEIPSHWEVWKITHAMDLIGSGTTPKSDNLEYYDGDVLWVTTSELRESYIDDSKQKVTDLAIQDCSALKKYPVNSVAIAMYGATIGRLGVLAREATFNQACCVFSGSKVLHYKFLYYWLWMRRPILISLSNGGGQPNLSQDDLKKLKLALPPIDEQKIIADFLDKRLAQVDALIAKQETLLEKLAEQRVALISHAVTKGLNPNVEMKESGVQWLGEIPSHWEVWKITHAMDLIGSGTTPKSDNSEYYDGEVLWVTTSELRESYIDDTKQKVTDLAIQDNSALKIYPVNSVAIAMYGATIGRLGILANEATFNQACCVFSGSKVLHYKFLYYWLWMRRPILISLSNGGGQPNLSQDDLKKLKMPLPCIDEQMKIAEYLVNETNKIDDMKGIVEKTIDRLKEYRSTLITQVVTGKIDVRNLKVN